MNLPDLYKTAFLSEMRLDFEKELTMKTRTWQKNKDIAIL